MDHKSGRYAAKQIDGTFPNCEHVIPKKTTKIGNVNTDQFKSEFHRVAYFALNDVKFSAVRVEFSKTGCAIDFNGGSTRTKTGIDGSFSPTFWALDAKRLALLLPAIEGDTFGVEATEDKELGPIKIIDGNLMILLMPVRPN